MEFIGKKGNYFVSKMHSICYLLIKNIYDAFGGNMPRVILEMLKSAQEALTLMKVFSFDQVLVLLNCSIRSGRLRMKQWGTYTSFNQNGRYYTMPSVPRFDEKGLWYYKDIYFSKHGNLKNTVVNLVNDSSSGLTGNEIGDLVRLSPRSFLHHFRDAPGICREKHGGVYVYFSDNPDKYKYQVQNRLKADILTEQSISDTDAVTILAAIIKHHGITIEDIMALPEIKARKFSVFAIREFLNRHNLLKKLRL